MEFSSALEDDSWATDSVTTSDLAVSLLVEFSSALEDNSWTTDSVLTPTWTSLDGVFALLSLQPANDKTKLSKKTVKKFDFLNLIVILPFIYKLHSY